MTMQLTSHFRLLASITGSACMHFICLSLLYLFYQSNHTFNNQKEMVMYIESIKIQSSINTLGVSKKIRKRQLIKKKKQTVAHMINHKGSSVTHISSRLEKKTVAITDQYIAKIRQLLDQNQFYPNLAKRKKIVGTVNVSFRLDRQGKLVAVELLDGKHEILKSAVRSLVSERVEFPPMPKQIKGHTILVKMPVRFAIKE